MTTPFFSIIIPCYNAGKYLSFCIESILCQVYNDFELILVNDGSKDNTPIICDKYAAKDKRIIVIHKENEGVSCARNIALERAIGKWIIFLDADDWFENNALEIIHDYTKQNSFDLIGFNSYYNRTGIQWKRTDITPNPLIRKDGELKWFKFSMLFPFYDFKINRVCSGAVRAVWGKAFKSEIINKYHIRFVEEVKIAEDALFCYDYLERSNKVVFINKYLIHYRIHKSSVIRSYTPNVIEINNKILGAFYKRIEKNLDQEDFRIVFQGLASDCIFRSLKQLYLHPQNKSSLFSKIKTFRNSIQTDIYKIALSYPNVKYLPHGKKEIISCVKKNWMHGAFLIAWISIKYLNIKNNMTNKK